MTKKHCESHKKRKLYRRLFYGFVAIILVLLLIILIVYLVLRPTKPRFVLQDAAIFQFNATGGSLLTTNLQISLLSRNPNDRIGIYYDRLDVYAAYRNQQVTLASRIPSTYQGHNDITVWSPNLSGVNIPVSPLICLAVQQDQNLGYTILNIRADGRIRWKVGTWVSGRYRLNINCAGYFRFSSGNGGINGAIVRLQQPVGCNVDV